ncbi:MAG: hypothetical protein IH828_08000 [Nitrospinae bacterium]|jgi:hypothetical protein|nr:hypothetical protein [Nitrospinota bacterium]MDV2479535.1 hypothetical protein [bacterium]
MTKQAWAEREAAWRRFHDWERSQTDRSTPQERLARAGELADLYLRLHGKEATEESLEKSVEAIRAVRKVLRFVRVSP